MKKKILYALGVAISAIFLIPYYICGILTFGCGCFMSLGSDLMGETPEETYQRIRSMFLIGDVIKAMEEFYGSR